MTQFGSQLWFCGCGQQRATVLVDLELTRYRVNWVCGQHWAACPGIRVLTLPAW